MVVGIWLYMPSVREPRVQATIRPCIMTKCYLAQVLAAVFYLQPIRMNQICLDHIHWSTVLGDVLVAMTDVTEEVFCNTPDESIYTY